MRTRILLSEFIGTLLLVAIVVGSGIMAEQLSQGNIAIALLANTLATAAGLFVLVFIFGPVGGNHFNPVVSLTILADKREAPSLVMLRILCQLLAGIAGTLLIHLAFDLPLIEWGSKARTGPGIWISEIIATAGLILVVRSGAGRHPLGMPLAVAAWICAGYWFTQSTCFANPAVSLARAFTDSFANIRLQDVPQFWVCQLMGAAIGYGLSKILFVEETPNA